MLFELLNLHAQLSDAIGVVIEFNLLRAIVRTMSCKFIARKITVVLFIETRNLWSTVFQTTTILFLFFC